MPSCLTRMLASFAKDKTTTKADIEACCRIFLFGEDDAKFSESEHPRDKDGKFSKGSSSGGKADGESKHEAPKSVKPAKASSLSASQKKRDQYIGRLERNERLTEEERTKALERYDQRKAREAAAEKKRLEAEVKQLEEHIAEVEKKPADLERQKKQLEERSAEAQRKIDEAEQKLRELKERSSQHKAQYEAIMAKWNGKTTPTNPQPKSVQPEPAAPVQEKPTAPAPVKPAATSKPSAKPPASPKRTSPPAKGATTSRGREIQKALSTKKPKINKAKQAQHVNAAAARQATLREQKAKPGQAIKPKSFFTTKMDAIHAAVRNMVKNGNFVEVAGQFGVTHLAVQFAKKIGRAYNNLSAKMEDVNCVCVDYSEKNGYHIYPRFFDFWR